MLLMKIPIRPYLLQFNSLHGRNFLWNMKRKIRWEETVQLWVPATPAPGKWDHSRLQEIRGLLLGDWNGSRILFSEKRFAKGRKILCISPWQYSFYIKMKTATGAEEPQSHEFTEKLQELPGRFHQKLQKIDFFNTISLVSTMKWFYEQHWE